MNNHEADPLKLKAGKALLKKRGRDWFSRIGKKGRRAQLKAVH